MVVRSRQNAFSDYYVRLRSPQCYRGTLWPATVASEPKTQNAAKQALLIDMGLVIFLEYGKNRRSFVRKKSGRQTKSLVIHQVQAVVHCITKDIKSLDIYSSGSGGRALHREGH